MREVKSIMSNKKWELKYHVWRTSWNWLENCPCYWQWIRCTSSKLLFLFLLEILPLGSAIPWTAGLWESHQEEKYSLLTSFTFVHAFEPINMFPVLSAWLVMNMTTRLHWPLNKGMSFKTIKECRVCYRFPNIFSNISFIWRAWEQTKASLERSNMISS